MIFWSDRAFISLKVTLIGLLWVLAVLLERP